MRPSMRKAVNTDMMYVVIPMPVIHPRARVVRGVDDLVITDSGYRDERHVEAVQPAVIGREQTVADGAGREHDG